VAFTEISSVYIDWSGEITAALAIDNSVDPYPVDVGLYASLGTNPYSRRSTISGGEITYPDPQFFDCRSKFELIGGSTWSDLLDGQGVIRIVITNLVIPGNYVDHGRIALNDATLVIEGVVVPEPATMLFFAIGVVGARLVNC
jgi:hypothetical protein